MNYVMLSESLLKAFAAVVLIQLPWLQADASSAESAERYVAKAFDGLCVQNAENLEVIDSIAKTNGWPAVDSEKLAAVSFGQKGLRGYAWKRDGVVYLVGINPDGACSVTAQSLNAQEIKKLLVQNFRLVDQAQAKLSEGFSVSELLTFRGESLYSGALIILTYMKEGPVGPMTISFITEELASRTRR